MLKRLRNFITELKQERRALGWKGVLRKRGWRLVLGFFVFYLVRDLILYVLIPFAVYTGFTGESSDDASPPDTAVTGAP